MRDHRDYVSGFALALLLVGAGGAAGQAESKAADAGLRRFEYMRPAPGAVVKERFVYCAEWRDWAVQEEAREHDPAEWAEAVRGSVASGVCRITRGGEALRVVGEADDGADGHLFAFIVAGPNGLQWYISPEAWPWER